jgi:hypothetical protein
MWRVLYFDCKLHSGNLLFILYDIDFVVDFRWTRTCKNATTEKEKYKKGREFVHQFYQPLAQRLTVWFWCWKLKWAFLIARCLASVCPSVRLSTSFPDHNLNTIILGVIKLCQLVHLGWTVCLTLKSGHYDLRVRWYGQIWKNPVRLVTRKRLVLESSNLANICISGKRCVAP